MATDSHEPADTDLLARGGGNATAAGVSFQASVGAIFAAQLLAERLLDDRLRLGEDRIRSLRFETEAPLDDILIETDALGWVFVQAKTTLSLSERLNSEFGKTVEQIVRQWQVCATGDGKRGWDRSLAAGRDRMLIAVGPDASGSISRDLAAGLASLQAPSAAPMPQAPQQALTKLSGLITEAWQNIIGALPSADELASVLRLITIVRFDMAGPDRTAAIETVSHVIEDAGVAPGAFDAIARHCENLMAARLGTDAANLRRSLARSGMRLRSAPSYQRDVEALRSYSAGIQSHLRQYENTRFEGVDIRIERACTSVVVSAARAGSLVIVGEPGAGKSAVISAAAERLRCEGHEVIELAVDRLPVDSLDGLRHELGVGRRLRDVLENWPGADAAFLFIDALDATRGGRSEAVFRTLISDVLDLAGSRWRVVASIRTFDLRLGEQFRELFQGAPPDRTFADSEFAGIRHVHVLGWTDDELAELLERAPALSTAIRRGGEGLRDLALVPFNTRLLADLINSGAAAEDFGEVGSQIELLAMYWRHRVQRHGHGAEVCLKAAVAQMVANRSLQARRVETAEADPTAFDNLMRSSVLVPVLGDRYVSFRHHILFDYAASRLFIDPTDVLATGELLRSDRGLGLILAPALSFALQELWEHGAPGHLEFWRAVVHFAGDSASNPVARSVAARSACELPANADDMKGFVRLLSTSGPEQELAFRAFAHVVGALSVRIEDEEAVPFTPWCHLAAQASHHVAELLWPLRTLIFLLIERARSPQERAWLGAAAHAMLEFALDHPNVPSHLTSAAIGFVADTYDIDATRSRRLLGRLLTPERLRDHAHEDMSWLARKVRPIGDADPPFVVDIYKTIFGFEVTDTAGTSIGNSRILPLTSNRRQDYEMARYGLKEAFPRFLQSHPREAIHALVAAMEGYVATKHPLGERVQEQTITVGKETARFIEDQSYIWAWNPENEQSDNALSLVKAFSSRLAEAPEEDARQILTDLIAANRLAILWSRIFMVGAKRPDLAEALWPYAIQPTILVSYETRKDALDLVAWRYPSETLSAREAFEDAMMRLEFPQANDPARAKQNFVTKVFAVIGAEHLATPAAQELARNAPDADDRPPNRRPFEIATMSSAPERYGWLEGQGADLTAPRNADILAQTEEVVALLGLDGGQAEQVNDVPRGVARLQALADAARGAAAAGTALSVIRYVDDMIARGCEKLALQTEALRGNPEVLNDLCALVDGLLVHASPEVEDDTEAKHETSMQSSGGARMDGAEAALNLCRIDSRTAERFTPALERLSRDPHPEVRLAIAHALALLWNTAPEAMWRIAAIYAGDEPNRRVLSICAELGTVFTRHGFPRLPEDPALAAAFGPAASAAVRQALAFTGRIQAAIGVFDHIAGQLKQTGVGEAIAKRVGASWISSASLPYASALPNIGEQ